MTNSRGLLQHLGVQVWSEAFLRARAYSAHDSNVFFRGSLCSQQRARPVLFGVGGNKEKRGALVSLQCLLVANSHRPKPVTAALFNRSVVDELLFAKLMYSQLGRATELHTPSYTGQRRDQELLYCIKRYSGTSSSPSQVFSSGSNASCSLSLSYAAAICRELIRCKRIYIALQIEKSSQFLLRLLISICGVHLRLHSISPLLSIWSVLPFG